MTYQFTPATIFRSEPQEIWLFQRHTAEMLVLDMAGTQAVLALLHGTTVPLRQRWPTWLLKHYLLGRCFLQSGKRDTDSAAWQQAIEQAQTLMAPLRSLAAPEALHISITSSCNQSCGGCFFSTGKGAKSQMMVFETYQQIIHTAAQHKVFQIALGGGEPLTHPDIVMMIQTATNHGLIANLTTNGTLLTPALADQFKQAGLGQLQLSLDGAEAAIHVQTRPHHDAVLKAMRICQQGGVRWGFNVLVTRQNVKHLETLLELAQQQGAYSVNLLRPKPAQNHPQWLEHVLPQPQDSLFLSPLLAKWQRKARFLLTLDASWSFVQATSHRPIPAMPIMGCSAGRRILAIQPNGQASPCGHFQGTDMPQGDFMRIWRADPLLDDFRKLEDTLQGVCQTCEHKAVCRGCRAIVMAQTGVFNGSDQGCPKWSVFASRI